MKKKAPKKKPKQENIWQDRIIESFFSPNGDAVEQLDAISGLFEFLRESAGKEVGNEKDEILYAMLRDLSAYVCAIAMRLKEAKS